ncbi:MAG: response regulator [Lautropia sp.]
MSAAPIAPAAQLLIVEDEPKLAALMTTYLQAAGYATQTIGDGRMVLPAVRAAMPDLILLDLMLPGRDGIDICRELRTFAEVPIVIVTARVEEIDRLLGLELGADDYICKPFSPREMVARVRAILRRSRSRLADATGAAAAPAAAAADAAAQAVSEAVAEALPEAPDGGTGGVAIDENRPVRLAIDEDRHQIRLEGRLLDLTPVEFRLLAILAAAPGRVYRRDALMERLYEDHRVVADRTVDTHVKNLRRKLMQVIAGRELIHSVYGIGYKYEP